jgi:hypothetical protein
MRRIRSHLTYANVISTLCLFLLLGGGTAVALNGSNTVFTDDIANDTFNSPTEGQGGLVAADLRPNSVGASEVVNFGLSNQDVGVEFAQVNADGTLAHSSGGVTSSSSAPGVYEVDYGHNISNCAFVTTEGEAGIGNAIGAITGNSDLASNVEATFTRTKNPGGATVARPFQQIVVC